VWQARGLGASCWLKIGQTQSAVAPSRQLRAAFNQSIKPHDDETDNYWTAADCVELQTAWKRQIFSQFFQLFLNFFLKLFHLNLSPKAGLLFSAKSWIFQTDFKQKSCKEKTLQLRTIQCDPMFSIGFSPNANWTLNSN